MESLPIQLTNGNCRELGVDVQVMYPPEGDVDAEAIAKSICIDCDASSICLSWALKNREQGVWAGTTERDRRTIVRERQRYGVRPRPS